MGSELEVFKLYTDRLAGRHVLLCIRRRSYLNSNGSDQAAAEAEIEETALAMLPQGAEWELVGEMQIVPIGDALLSRSTPNELSIWVVPTEFGHPWVILGTADTEDNFWRAINDDEDCTSLRPRGNAQELSVTYVRQAP